MAKQVISLKKAATPAYEGDGLPEDQTDQDVKLTSLRWLFIAPPGFGKTEFFALFPNTLMLACEEGHKFVTGYKIIIDSWTGKEEWTDSDNNLHLSYVEAVRRIEHSTRFDFVMVDTVDALVKKCIDYHIAKVNMEHLSELGEYGKGYDIGQNDPFRRTINQLATSGRGLGLITHQQVETRQFKKGAFAKKETTLPNGILKIVFPQMDLIIHGEFGGIRDGQKHKDRIIRSEGSEDILAKNRGGVLPPAWISPYDMIERAAQVRGFFEGDKEQRKANIDAAYAEYLKYYEA